MPLAVIDLSFDPVLRLGGFGVRWETLGLAGSALVGLVLAGLVAGRTSAAGSRTPRWARDERVHLRRDDLVLIVLGALPGAVAGGRLGYVLIHVDFYSANPAAILDPGQGSLELGLGLIGGLITGAYVARLLDAPVRTWLHVAAAPVFLAIGLGELARLAGGSGQGAPTAAAWATAFTGPGPWGSLAPAIPAQPAQVYEAIAAGVAVVVICAIGLVGGFRRRDGSAFFVGLAVWASGRAIASLAWRDDPVVGPVPAGGLVAAAIVVIAIVGLAVLGFVGRRPGRVVEAESPAGPAWPDPASRPRF